MNYFSIKTSLFLLLSITLTASSCNKDNMDDKDKDWNVLEWTVDGERYKAECEGGPLFGCDPVDCQYYHDTKSLAITGSSLFNNAILIYKYENLKTDGTKNILQESDELGYNNSNLEVECRDHLGDPLSNYILKIIELDTLNKKIEGNFEFTGINDCQDTVRVEDGYFKLSYRP